MPAKRRVKMPAKEIVEFQGRTKEGRPFKGSMTVGDAAKQRTARKKVAKKRDRKKKKLLRKPGRIPKEVQAAIKQQLPKNLQNAPIMSVTKRGNGYRVIVEGNGKEFKVFTWVRKETGWKLFPVNKLNVTKITRAKSHVRGRTVKTTIGP